MRIEQLKGCKKSAVIGWMAGMLLLAGCTQDKLADASQGEMLPEGKYPVTFTATGLEISAATRATADGTWDNNDAVAVKIGSEIKRYVIDSSSGETTTLKPADAANTFYWQSTNEIKYVSAWYFHGSSDDDILKLRDGYTVWSVQQDQSHSENYQHSDFLYAPEKEIDFNGNKSLTFYHQVAKVVVNIRKNGVSSDASNIGVTIIADNESCFHLSNTRDYVAWASTGNHGSSKITPLKLESANADVNFENGEKPETALASYQALVIPQELGGVYIVKLPFIQININGYEPFKYYPYPTSEKWEGGRQYTYNLTINGSAVTATVNSSIGWKEGDTGSGSVKI